MIPAKDLTNQDCSIVALDKVYPSDARLGIQGDGQRDLQARRQFDSSRSHPRCDLGHCEHGQRRGESNRDLGPGQRIRDGSVYTAADAPFRR